MSKNIRIFLKKKFIEEYDFRSTLFVIEIFDNYTFLTTLFSKMASSVQFLTTFTQPKTRKLFKGLVVGFGPKGMPGRMCDIVR